jgi:hypothetical protein
MRLSRMSKRTTLVGRVARVHDKAGQQHMQDPALQRHLRVAAAHAGVGAHAAMTPSQQNLQLMVLVRQAAAKPLAAQLLSQPRLAAGAFQKRVGSGSGPPPPPGPRQGSRGPG